MGAWKEWIHLCYTNIWTEYHPEPCLCPDSLQLCFTISPRGRQVRQCWQHTVACRLFLQCVFCSHQTRNLLLVLSLWLSSGELWLEGMYSKPSKSEEENSCHQQKRKWLEWSQPTVSYEFLLPSGLISLPHKGKQNKTRMHCHVSAVGSKATEASEVTLSLFLPFSLVLVLKHRPLLPVKKGSFGLGLAYF